MEYIIRAENRDHEEVYLCTFNPWGIHWTGNISKAKVYKSHGYAARDAYQARLQSALTNIKVVVK